MSAAAKERKGRVVVKINGTDEVVLDCNIWFLLLQNSLHTYCRSEIEPRLDLSACVLEIDGDPVSRPDFWDDNSCFDDDV